MDQESQDIAAFFDSAEADEKARQKAARPARAPRPKKVEPAEGSLEEAEEEGRRLRAREERRAAYLKRTPTVQNVGKGPEADTRPKCRLCGDHRRLTPALIKLPDGTEGRLCPTCVKQVEWDRERRCVSCGTPTRHWTPGGVCSDCHDKGTERLRNIEELRRKRWVLMTGDFTP